jgi:serine/threonine protein phosphatase PrpC
MQGWRQEMEDDHIAQDMPSRQDHTFLAVFDGYIVLHYIVYDY